MFQFGLHHWQQFALVATPLAEHANLKEENKERIKKMKLRQFIRCVDFMLKTVTKRLLSVQHHTTLKTNIISKKDAYLGLQPGQQPHLSHVLLLCLVPSGQGLQGNQPSLTDIAKSGLQGFVRGGAEENKALSGLEGGSGQVQLSQQLKSQLASAVSKRE